MNRKKTIHGIDLTAPGGLEALFAFRRAQFGDAMMMADGDGGDGGDGAAAGAGEGGDVANDAAAAAAAAADAAKGATAWDGKIESLPADVQKVIKDLRTEAAGNRTGKTAAEQQLAAIQKALNPDAKGNEKPDTDALTKALAEREADTKQAKTELAVYRLAGKNGADPDALLDSRGFLAKLADIDPSDTAKVTKAITDAVTENPKLKAVLAAGASGADLSGGSGEKRNRSNVTLDSALSTHYGK